MQSLSGYSLPMLSRVPAQQKQISSPHMPQGWLPSGATRLAATPNIKKQADISNQIFVVLCVLQGCRLGTTSASPRVLHLPVIASAHIAFDCLLYATFSMTGKGWGYEGRLGGSQLPTAH